MEVGPRKIYRTINLVLIVAILFLIAGASTATLVTATGATALVKDNQPLRRLVARIALLSAATLGLALVLLLWVLMRSAAGALRARKPHQPTDYVDAWTAAGERIQLDDEDTEADQDDGPDRS